MHFFFGPPPPVEVEEGQVLVESTGVPGGGGTDSEGDRVSSSSGRGNVDSDRASTSAGVPDHDEASVSLVAPASEVEVEAPVPGRSLIFRKWQALADDPRVSLGLFLVGWLCSLFSPLFFTIGDWPMGAGAIIFTFLCLLGLEYRGRSILRTTPNMFIQTLCIVFSIGLTVYVGVSFETTERGIIGFMVIGVATFCWTQIVQPCFDYGVLQLVTCIPMQIAIMHTRGPGGRFKPWYVFTGVLPLACLLGQAFFVQHFNAKYIREHGKDARRLDAT